MPLTLRYVPSSCSIFLLVFALAGQVVCRPLLGGDSNNIVKATTFQNLDSVDSGMQCCSVTFSPTTLSDGSPGVQVVQSCSIIVADSCPPPTTQSPLPPSSTSISTTTSSSGVSSVSQTNTATPASSSIISITSIFIPSSTSDAPTPITTLSFSSPSTSVVTSTSTSNASNPSDTPTASGAIAAPKQSTVLPKVIGAFAGVSIICLIIGGTIGYFKQKKLKERKDEAIAWPNTR